MLRRRAISILFAGFTRYPIPDSAALIDVRDGDVLAAGPLAHQLWELPGSTLKPLVLASLLRSGRLRDSEEMPCPGRLRIAGRTFDCSHPPLDHPVNIDTALAYSCNAFVARAAARFGPGELAAELRRYGLGERIQDVRTAEGQQLQALGEDAILTTPAGLAAAYRLLARHAPAPVVRGLEMAVEFGTARHAKLSGVSVAGKTGSVIGVRGQPAAWFAGFAPSRSPQVAVAVLVPGRSGGADAAPVARGILEQHFRRRP